MGERRARRLKIALGLNLVVVAVQIVMGITAHSVGLIADAGHNLTDVVALGVSLVAVTWAQRGPTARRSFGYHRGTILAALANSASILAVTVYIVYEAIDRLLNPEPVRGGIVVAVALIAMVINALSLLVVREGHGSHGHAHADPNAAEHHVAEQDAHHSAAPADLNMRSAVLHMAGDALASLGVAIAGVVILLTDGTYWLDPAVSLGIGALIAWQAWILLRQAVDVLLESTPADLDIDALADAIRDVDGVDGVHDLHVWSLSTEMRALSAHLLVAGHPSLEDARAVGDQAKAMISRRFGIAHATLELECEECFDVDVDPCGMEPVRITGHHHP